MGYFRILGAIPGFFLGSLVLMLLWNVIVADLGIDKIGYAMLSSLIVMLLWGVIARHLELPGVEYPMAMLITITSWLAVGPLAFVRAKSPWPKR